jgi:hypothetical protein
MFQKLASNALRGEIGVVVGPGGDPELAAFVRSRGPIAGLTQSDPAPVFLPIAVTRISAAPAAPPAPKSQFPALTLGSQLLSQRERDQFHSSGIVSTLDLIGFSADQLALRLGTDARTARQLRLKAVGIDPTL